MSPLRSAVAGTSSLQRRPQLHALHVQSENIFDVFCIVALKKKIFQKGLKEGSNTLHYV